MAPIGDVTEQLTAARIDQKPFYPSIVKRFFCILIYSTVIISCYDDSAIWERIDALEAFALSSIEIQISSVKESIHDLEDLNRELKAEIDSLESADSIPQEIDLLKMLHFSLVERTEDLKELINSEIYDTRQWADAKFASLELYNTIVDELCALQTIVVSNYEELEDHINKSIDSIYQYVEFAFSGYYTSKEIDALLEEIEGKIEDLEIYLGQFEGTLSVPSTPCMYNPSINFKKENLKILDVGNSYTDDSQSYLLKILSANNQNSGFSLYAAIRGGASFKSWYDCYWDNDTYSSYSIVKKAGDTIKEVSGKGNPCDGTLFRNALSSVDWDIIIIHQVSTYSNDFTLWEGHSNAGYLNEFIQILRETNPQATIGFLLVHSYASSYQGNTERSSIDRWGKIADATKQIKSHYGIDFIIPYGTAVQNLRASSLNDKHEFSTDGTHLATGLGDYVASCCYYQALFAPRFGTSIIGNSFREVNLDENIAGVKNINDLNAHTAQKAAMLANYNMWSIMNPDDYTIYKH